MIRFPALITSTYISDNNTRRREKKTHPGTAKKPVSMTLAVNLFCVVHVSISIIRVTKLQTDKCSAQIKLQAFHFSPTFGRKAAFLSINFALIFKGTRMTVIKVSICRISICHSSNLANFHSIFQRNTLVSSILSAINKEKLSHRK